MSANRHARTLLVDAVSLPPRRTLRSSTPSVHLHCSLLVTSSCCSSPNIDAPRVLATWRRCERRLEDVGRSMSGTYRLSAPLAVPTHVPRRRLCAALVVLTRLRSPARSAFPLLAHEVTPHPRPPRPDRDVCGCVCVGARTRDRTPCENTSTALLVALRVRAMSSGWDRLRHVAQRGTSVYLPRD